MLQVVPTNSFDQEPSNFTLLIEAVIMFLFGWPAYLICNIGGRDYGKFTNHFNPNSPIFNRSHFNQVLLSDFGIIFTIGILIYVSYIYSFTSMICYYGFPLLMVNFWLILYTYLHHTDLALPHFRSEKWNWIQGALSTVDRDYGFILNTLHHNIGNTHILHHLFSTIPHYHAVEASNAIKPILGDYYYENKDSIWFSLWKTTRYCRFVDDSQGNDVLWYQPKSLFNRSPTIKENKMKR